MEFKARIEKSEIKDDVMVLTIRCANEETMEKLKKMKNLRIEEKKVVG